jgi:uncharacterized protein
MTDNVVPPCIPVLAKPSGSMCNLNCANCFYLKKELSLLSRFRMGDEVLEGYISKLIEIHRTGTVTHTSCCMGSIIDQGTSWPSAIDASQGPA